MMYQLHKEVNAEDYPDGQTRVWGRCKITNKAYECWAPTAGLKEWQLGTKIQLALPEVSAGDREFIKSGISPDGWDQLFGDPA